MNDSLRAVQDKAWDIKEACDDLASRKLSRADEATLQSVQRDLVRLEQKLVGIRDKRKRGPQDGDDEPAAPPPAAPAQAGLDIGGGDGG